MNRGKPDPERVAVMHVTYVLAATAIALDALNTSRRLVDEDHGCPEGTTCPVCMPLRRAIKDLSDVHEQARDIIDSRVRE